jgi:phage-related protein
MRRISWIKAARKDFEKFPEAVQIEAETALGIAAEGRKAETAKPLKRFDGGIFEIASRRRGDAFRLWVIHAFQKKSKTGIKTPQVEIDLIRERLKRLKEMLR